MEYWNIVVPGSKRRAAKRPNFGLFGRRFRAFAKGNGTKKTSTYFDNKLSIIYFVGIYFLSSLSWSVGSEGQNSLGCEF